jgi:hypothetical protein
MRGWGIMWKEVTLHRRRHHGDRGKMTRAECEGLHQLKGQLPMREYVKKQRARRKSRRLQRHPWDKRTSEFQERHRKVSDAWWQRTCLACLRPWVPA